MDALLSCVCHQLQVLPIDYVYSVAAPARLVPDYRRVSFPGPAATYPAMAANESAAASQVGWSGGVPMPATVGMLCSLPHLVPRGCGPTMWLAFH